MATPRGKEHIDHLNTEDWDQRPENICICGYPKATCMCKVKPPVQAAPAAPRVYKPNKYLQQYVLA